MPFGHFSWMSGYWLVWFLQFLVVELYFVFKGNGAWGTLSETAWSLEDLNKAQPFDFAMWTDVHWIVALLVWGCFLWLSLHIPFGLLR